MLLGNLLAEEEGMLGEWEGKSDSIGDSTMGWGMPGEETERNPRGMLVGLEIEEDFWEVRDCCDKLRFRCCSCRWKLAELSERSRIGFCVTAYLDWMELVCVWGGWFDSTETLRLGAGAGVAVSAVCWSSSTLTGFAVSTGVVVVCSSAGYSASLSSSGSGASAWLRCLAHSFVR